MEAHEQQTALIAEITRIEKRCALIRAVARALLAAGMLYLLSTRCKAQQQPLEPLGNETAIVISEPAIAFMKPAAKAKRKARAHARPSTQGGGK